MNQVNRHIISSLNWNTSFDRKEGASELQARLSTWSNIRLQRVLSDVFDSVCPPEQTWKIGAIELDLGTIEYGELESELSIRVRRELMDKLAEMIRYPDKNGSTDFEILDEQSSKLELIENFLLTGTMPWNASAIQESADRILAGQLKDNRAATVEMLWKTGAVSENVRKRMAWQFSDPTVITIIEALEPNNHGQIIQFSDEMTEIQRKESIVQSNVTDLRKNIWLWVLNYLYNERGTIFNKVAFMKSTITQMAAHHNIGYKELMDLIERAVNELKKRSGLFSDFTVALNILSEQNRTAKHREAAALEQVTDHWYTLEILFREPSLRRTKSRNAEFNDLVVSLSRSDKPRLAELVRSVAKDKAIRVSSVADLQEFSLEIIFSALLPTTASLLVRSISFLQALGNETKVWKDHKVLWNAALKFALENKTATISNEIFIAYCIAEIANEIGQPASSVLTQLAKARVPSELKTVSALAIYSDLLTVSVQAEKTAELPSSIASRLKEVIDALAEQVNSSTGDREIFLSLRRLLERRINAQPKIAFETLMTYPRKNVLRKLLPFLLSDAIANTLLRNLQPEFQSVLVQLKQAVDVLKASSSVSKISELLTERLKEWTLEALFTQPGIDPDRLSTYILEKLESYSGKTYAAQFILFCHALSGQGNPALKSVAEKIVQDHERNQKIPLAQRVRQLMQSSVKMQAAVGNMLAAHFTNTGFTEWRKPGRKEGVAILNFLLPSGKKWMKKLVKEYKAMLLPGLTGMGGTELEVWLGETYWKCILDYADHGGKIASLRKSFHAAVVYRFAHAESRNVSGKRESKKSRSSTEKTYRLKSGDVLTLRELFACIARCLEESSTALNEDGRSYEFRELLNLGLELKPSEIRKIIARIPLTDSRLQVLKTAGSFRQLSLWIMSDLRGEMNSAMETMRMLHDMITLIVPGEDTEKFLDEFWTETWTLIAAGSWSRGNLKKLIRSSFTKMAAEFDVNAATFITEMKNKKIRLTPGLRDDLIACFPAFAALPENERETSAGRKLAEFERRGLLDSLVEHLVTQKRIPSWFGDSGEEQVKALLEEVILHHPIKFLQVMKREIISESQVRWLSQAISFTELTRSIGYLNREKQASLAMLAEFHAALGKITVMGISPGVLQEILFRKLMKAWSSNNWRLVSVENIWNELLWDVCMKYNLPKRNFLRDLEKAAPVFPPAIKIALENIMERDEKPAYSSPTKAIEKKKRPLQQSKSTEKTAPAGITVYNAGMVMLSTYVPMLFDRLGLTSGKKFVSTQAQHDAAHYLQYVVTGLSKTEESFLPLNKVLCGLPLSHPVQDGIEITDEQKKLIDGLISAAISHWPVIGDTSITGFRGNWLVREGMLTEFEQKWELIVEKRAYDILINKSPYSFSMIRYPWMDKSLHVTWPY